MFLANSLVCIAICNQSELYRPVQEGFAFLAVLIIVIHRTRGKTIGHAIVVGLTVAFRLFSPSQIGKGYLYLPVLYLYDCSGIRTKLTTIGNVITQTIWMLISVAVCSYVFGGVAYMVYTRNNPYFNGRRLASLVFLQLATLDDLGKITKQNYADRSFFAAIATVAVVLFFAHCLFTTNTALVLAYISDEHRDNKELLDVNRNLIGQHVPLKHRLLRFANIFVSIWVLFDSYDTARSGLYLVTAIVSMTLLQCSQLYEDKVRWYRTLLNWGSVLIAMLCFLTYFYTGLYITLMLRIILIPEVKANFKKVYWSMFEASSFLMLGLAFLIVYAFAMHAINRNRSIYMEAIEALQLSCLDEHGTFLHDVNWLKGLVMIAFMVFVNHLVMNIVVAQLFNAIEQADIDQKIMENLPQSRELSEVEDEFHDNRDEQAQEKIERYSLPRPIPPANEMAEKFALAAKNMNYRPLSAISPLD